MRQFFSLIYFALAMCACAKSPTESIQYEYVNDPAQVFRLKFVALEEPGRYQAELAWPEDPTSSGFTILKTRGSNKEQIYLGHLTRWLDTNITGGETVTYTLLAASRSEPPQPTAEVKGRVPVDLVLAGAKSLTAPDSLGHEFYGRVYFKADAQLETLDRNLTLQGEELISEGGTLRTFSPQHKAALETPGRSGGRIQLKFKRASGVLHIQLYGEKGGDGPNGATGLVGGAGSNGGLCQNGAHGGKGYQGKPGGYGYRGGDSGEAFVEILEPDSKLQVEFEVEPAIGGAGGRGGLGGPGGPPGQRGPTDQNRRSVDDGRPGRIRVEFTSACGAGSTIDGNTGSQGDDGPSGEPGEPGKIRNYCYSNAGKTLGRCPTP